MLVKKYARVRCSKLKYKLGGCVRPLYLDWTHKIEAETNFSARDKLIGTFISIRIRVTANT